MTLARRKFPRRDFNSVVGVLYRGNYSLERTQQVGEGGMMLSYAPGTLPDGALLAVSFYLPSGELIMLRGSVRYNSPLKPGDSPRYGIEFLNVNFHYKREIRNYVAAALKLTDLR